ncbi:MAG: helix-turn-helix domain-containing protein [Streptococcaceae bacterium]|jgi:Rgg/GadR/MutR family transcriptional activator|nr:helix-turn-helix domain-containing protein [Streptococcaceae bacterium]
MYYLGPAFREIREAKKLSIRETARGIISPSFLSKWERGESHISIINLISLLERITSTLNELILFHENLEFHYQNFLDETMLAVRRKDLNTLVSLLEKLEATPETDDQLLKEHRIIILNQHINQLTGIPFDKKSILVILNHLKKAQIWGIYELLLYAHSLFFLTTADIKIMSNISFQRSGHFKAIPQVRTIIGRIFSDTLKRFLNEQLLNESAKILKLGRDFLEDSSALSERAELHLLEGVYLIKTGEQFKGLSYINKTLDFLTELSCDDLVASLYAYLATVPEYQISSEFPTSID